MNLSDIYTCIPISHPLRHALRSIYDPRRGKREDLGPLEGCISFHMENESWIIKCHYPSSISNSDPIPLTFPSHLGPDWCLSLPFNQVFVGPANRSEFSSFPWLVTSRKSLLPPKRSSSRYQIITSKTANCPFFLGLSTLSPKVKTRHCLPPGPTTMVGNYQLTIIFSVLATNGYWHQQSIMFPLLT